jgi:hypothetical protein
LFKQSLGVIMSEDNPNREKIHQQLYEAAESLEQALEKDIEMEEFIEKEITEDIERLEEIKQAAKQVMQDENKELRDLKEIHKDFVAINKDIKKESQSRSQDELLNYLHDQLERVRDAANALSDFQDNFQEEQYDVEIEVEEAIEDVIELNATFQSMAQLRNQLHKIRNIEEGLRTIAQQEGYDDVLGLLREADGAESTAEEHYSNMDNKAQRLAQELQEVDSAINDEAQLNKEEIQELKEDLTEDKKLFKEIKQRLEPLVKERVQTSTDGPGRASKTDRSQEAEEIVGELETLEEGMKSINQQLEKMIKFKTLEEQGEQEAINKLSEMWQKVSQSAQNN